MPNSSIQASTNHAPRLDNRIRVDTPEQIRFQYQVVGGSIRVIALLLDLIFMCLIFLTGLALYFLSVMLLAFFSFVVGVNFFGPLSGLGLGMFFLLLFSLWWFYGAIQEYRFKGQTWGKMCVGIRVLGIDGRTPTFAQCAWRNFLRLADCLPVFPIIFLIPSDGISLFGEPSREWDENLLGITAFLSKFFPTFGAAAVSMMATTRFQRIGDLFSGTMVVDVQKTAKPFVPVYNDLDLLHLATTMPRGFSPGRDLVEVLTLYVSRRQRFSVPRRRQIAAPLANTLIAEFGLPKESDPDLVVGATYLRAVCDPSQLDVMYDEALRAQPVLARP